MFKCLSRAACIILDSRVDFGVVTTYERPLPQARVPRRAYLGDSKNTVRRVLFRHPSIRRIAERLKTLQTNIRILEIPEYRTLSRSSYVECGARPGTATERGLPRSPAASGAVSSRSARVRAD